MDFESIGASGGVQAFSESLSESVHARLAPLPSRAALEHPLVAQPVDAAPRPGRAGLVARSHPEAVASGSIDVQLRRDAGSLQGQVHDDAVAHLADGVIARVDEEE